MKKVVLAHKVVQDNPVIKAVQDINQVKVVAREVVQVINQVKVAAPVATKAINMKKAVVVEAKVQQGNQVRGISKLLAKQVSPEWVMPKQATREKAK